MQKINFADRLITRLQRFLLKSHRPPGFRHKKRVLAWAKLRLQAFGLPGPKAFIKKLLPLLTFSMIMVISSCAHQKTIDPTNLASLQSLNDRNAPKEAFVAESNELRIKALQEIGMSIGAQGGLAVSTTKINERLTQDKMHLDALYNFNGMMLSHGVLPPVLVEGDYTLNQPDSTTIRVSDKTYTIVEQARFATAPPNWRDYLWTTYEKPEIPRKFLLPRNKEEQKVWAEAVQKGWEKGIQQSYDIFHQNLARLKRDFNGMILYRKLLQEKMISPPFVSRTELGVTGNGTDMRVNDQVLRITELPQLNTDSNHWKAIVVKHDE